jgi:hypothetical protein
VKPADAGFGSLPPRTTCSLGIEIQGGRAVVLIPEGSLAPVAHAQTFTTVADGQRALEIRVVSCDPRRRPARLIVRFLLGGIRMGRRGEARIEIGIALDSSCGLRAWAAESGSGARQEVFCSGFSAFPADARVKSLASLIRHFSTDNLILRSAARAGIRSEIEEITDRTRSRLFFVPAGTTARRDGRRHNGEHHATRISGSDSFAALHTLAGEIASLERSSSPPISIVAEEPRTLPRRPAGHRHPAGEPKNVQ